MSVAVLLFIALFTRYLPVGEDLVVLSFMTAVRNSIHVFLLVARGISLHRRIVNLQIRNIMVATGELMIFWFVPKL